MENERRIKEMKSLFDDPKFSRRAFRAVGAAIAMRPAVKPSVEITKDGLETYESLVRRYTYEALWDDCKKAGTEPTMLEFIMACQAMMATTNASNFVAWADRVGAKPIDESKVEQTSNVFEGLTDEELEVLATMRANAKAATESAPVEPSGD